MNRALFLDRDGVINVDTHFVHRIDDFKFAQGIFDVARMARDLKYLLVVVTNQSGIARGYFSERAYFDLTDWMCLEFERQGAPLTQVYHCPFHPDFPCSKFEKFSSWRKPAPGMLLQAAKDHEIDLAKSIMIGDRISDLQAADAAHLKCFFYLDDGHAALPEVQVAVFRVPNLSAVSSYL